MSLNAPGSRYLYVVRAVFADAEREARWNEWYDRKHVPDLLSVPGFVSATRFEQRGADGHYLALYEIESPRGVRTAAVRRGHRLGRVGRRDRGMDRTVYRLDDTLPVDGYARDTRPGSASGR